MKPSLSAGGGESTPDPDVDGGDVRLIDTSVWIRADRKKQKEFQQRLKGLVIAGTAYICWPIHVELLIGAKDQDSFSSLDEQLSVLPHLPMTDKTWRESANIGWKLARSGQTVPPIDLLIAATAIEHDMILWTVDSDFKRVGAVVDLRADWFGLN